MDVAEDRPPPAQRAPAPGASRSKGNKIPRGPAEPAEPQGQRPPGGREEPGVEGQLGLLEGRLQALLLECRPSGADAARAEACLEDLRAVVGSIGPEWSLEIFGSLASHFSTSSSDVDATCVKAGKPGDQPWEAHAAARVLREKIAPLLRGHPRLTVKEEVFSAKVPIMRLRFDGLLDIDLSCQNLHALCNTRYLRAYADMDARVRNLGIAVKLWAKSVGVCGAAQGHLSSYAFTLLVIYFMQVHPDVHLPCLPTKAFEDGGAGEKDSRVSELSGSWSCDLGLAQLLARFFWFYHRDFMWGQEVASPRLGCRLLSLDRAFPQLRGRWAARLHVEDPFRLERNLHHVLGDAEETRLREALKQALSSILVGGVPAGLQPPSRPAAPPPGEAPRAGPPAKASPRASSASSASASTSLGEADAKDAPSPAGSVSPASDEEPEPPPAGEEPLARWQRRQQRPPPKREEAPGAEGGMDGQYEWWHSLGPAAEPPTQRLEEGRRPPESHRGSARQESHRQRWLWRRGEPRAEEDRKAGRAESAPEPGGAAGQRQPVCLTVQDLEDKMGRVPGTSPAPGQAARPFAALSTNKIASRVSKACLAHSG